MRDLDFFEVYSRLGSGTVCGKLYVAKSTDSLTPTEAGVQDMQNELDSRFRGNDGLQSLAGCGDSK